MTAYVFRFANGTEEIREVDQIPPPPTTPPEVRATFHPECGAWLDLVEEIEPDGSVRVSHAGAIEVVDRSEIARKFLGSILN